MIGTPGETTINQGASEMVNRKESDNKTAVASDSAMMRNVSHSAYWYAAMGAMILAATALKPAQAVAAPLPLDPASIPKIFILPELSYPRDTDSLEQRVVIFDLELLSVNNPKGL